MDMNAITGWQEFMPKQVQRIEDIALGLATTPDYKWDSDWFRGYCAGRRLGARALVRLIKGERGKARREAREMYKRENNTPAEY